MFHSFKRLWLVWALIFGWGQSVFGFALLGPFEPYQVAAIGYNEVPPASGFGDIGGGVDLGGPKNFGQGFRWNTPTNYYAYDEPFLEYFGSNGVAAVDQAFAMYNNLTNASSLNLADWPFKSTRVNFRAQALQLLDLKSFAMSLIIEQLGLAQPDRWTWALHDRFLPGGAQCPAFEYLIIQRNFDPATYNYSSFVNGVFYDYQIEELCVLNPNPFAPLGADAVEVQVDPTTQADSFGAVAAFGSDTPLGSFFLGFTRDDIGGLKYLYSATNAFLEAAETNSLQMLTNQNVQLLITSNLAVFESQALTNDAATLIGLYPGLVITATTNFFTNVVTTNVTAFLTNPPFSPAGTVQLVLVTNFVTNVQTLFFHTFANVVIVHAYSKGFVEKQTVSLAPQPFAPAGIFTTNVTTSISLQNFTNGDFYILPTNLCGPFQIIATQFVNVVGITNFIPISTNAFLITNNNSTIPISEAFITFFTNYFLLVHEVDCVTNSAAVREGMEHVTFVRRDFDSLLNRLVWNPVTNIYHLTAITNGVPVVQTFRRILNTPDIIVTAQDLAGGPATPLFDPATVRTAPNFNVSQVPPNQGGPGTIAPEGVQLTFNSVGPISFNVGPALSLGNGVIDFLQTNSVQLFQWGSFDGTTNDPVVYPSSVSIANLEAQLFFQIISGEPPQGSVSGNTSSNPYSFQLQATGGSPPYTWSLTSNSAGLPPGLTLSSGGLISGAPTTPGTYDFTVQATDIGARTTKQDLFIVIGP